MHYVCFHTKFNVFDTPLLYHTSVIVQRIFSPVHHPFLQSHLPQARQTKIYTHITLHVHKYTTFTPLNMKKRCCFYFSPTRPLLSLHRMLNDAIYFSCPHFRIVMGMTMTKMSCIQITIMFLATIRNNTLVCLTEKIKIFSSSLNRTCIYNFLSDSLVSCLYIELKNTLQYKCGYYNLSLCTPIYSHFIFSDKENLQ